MENGVGMQTVQSRLSEKVARRLSERPVYLDYQATTPLDRRVLDAMMPWWTERFGNPHSRGHAFGREAEAAVEQAREAVAAVIGAEGREIVFTSGATESNNLALKGVLWFQRGRPGGKDHLVTCATEHKCVLDSCRYLEEQGFAVTRLPVRPDGLIDLDRLASAITERTALVSIMAVNNEIGVIQPLAEIGALCRARGVLFHTDAAQAVGKIPLDVAAMAIDLMSISGHKLYGPKGIGALYVRRRPRVRLEPLIHGGGQERGLRSGTLPAPLCVGLGEACAIAAAEMPEEAARLRSLRDRLLSALQARRPELQVNGDLDRRVAGNLNISFPGIDAEALIEAARDVAVSTGSACSSASVEPSYVLRALGLPEDLARGSIRVGLGRFTTAEEVDFAADRLADAVDGLLRA
jgi:cysteine desulfurase